MGASNAYSTFTDVLDFGSEALLETHAREEGHLRNADDHAKASM